MLVVKREATKGYLDTWLWVPKSHINVDGTKSALTHEIADSYHGHTRLLYLWRETPDHLLLPRAFWSPEQLPFPVVDCRPRYYQEIDFRSRIKLDHRIQELNGQLCLTLTGEDVQQRSLAAMMASPGGVLQLACAKGKTIIALEYIARSKMPAIVHLDNTNLLYQWKSDIEEFLDVPGGVGLIAEGKKDWQKGLVLATYHSVANWSDTMPEEVRRWFGSAWWDEGHHVSAPTFAKSADLFYGERFSLSATPTRDDGLHIVSDLHIGPVVYKDLRPILLPTFAFYWTGLSLNMKDPNVAAAVLDTTNEVHLSKVYTYFGQWKERLRVIIETAGNAYSSGRKIIVLSNSVGEIANLMHLWKWRVWTGMYTDIPEPTPQDVGETLQPIELDKQDNLRLIKVQRRLEAKLEKLQPQDPDYAIVSAELTLVLQKLKQFQVFKKMKNEMDKRQKAYIKKLAKDAHDDPNCDCGFLTYGVEPSLRQWFLDNRKVIFAVSKYGKEGLDCPELDTVILSSLFSSHNSLQQLMGRPTRPMPGKKNPVIVFMVDNVGQCIGMTEKLKTHLRSWPYEEGGPYDPILIDHPLTWKNRKKTTLSELFTQ